MKCKLGKNCLQGTNDRGQCWLLDCLTDSGGKGKESKAKDICHFPELVILHSLLFMWMTGKVCFCFFFIFFSRRETLELYLLLWFCMWGGEKSCLVDELDKLLWTTIRTVAVIHFSFLHPAAGCGDVCANGGRGGPRGCSTHRSAGTMGHGPFHCIAPLSDLSDAHGCCLHGHRHLCRLPVCCFPPTQPTTTHIR